MAAENKNDLLEVTHKEFDKLRQLIQSIDEAKALAKDEDDTSIKDVVAHRAHWIGLFLGWYKDGQEGKEVHFPAKGYKWNELKRFNADLRRQQADLTWRDTIDALHKSGRELVYFLDSCSEDALYGGPMKGANNHWTPGRWAEAAGPSHFRSAAKYIRARLRALR